MAQCTVYILYSVALTLLKMRSDFKPFSDIFFAAYIGEMFTVLVESADVTLKNVAKTLKDLTPAPMNRMLERMPKEQAVKKHKERKQKNTIDVPATSTGKSTCSGSSSCAGVYISVEGTLTTPSIQLIYVVPNITTLFQFQY